MVVQRDKVLIYIIFISGLLASLVGGVKVGAANLHSYFVFSSLFLLILLFFSWGNIKLKWWYFPIGFTLFISIPRFEDQIGFLQVVYTVCPFICFLIGITVNFNENFKSIFLKISNNFLYVVGLCCILYLSTGFTELDSRAASIFIALILLINLILPSNKKFKILSFILSLFILIVGARGALLSFFISYLLAVLIGNFKLRYSIFFIAVISFIFIIYNKLIFAIIFSNQYLRERTFYDGVYNYDKLKNMDFNTSGRDLAWPVYWEHISKRSSDVLLFLFGDGPGRASSYGLKMLGSSWAHPHNEFIRIIFDYGVFGLFAFIVFWLNILYFILRWGGVAEKKICIGISVFTLLIMSTDNPLMYPLYYGDLSLFLLGYSYALANKNKCYILSNHLKKYFR